MAALGQTDQVEKVKRASERPSSKYPDLCRSTTDEGHASIDLLAEQMG